MNSAFCMLLHYLTSEDHQYWAAPYYVKAVVLSLSCKLINRLVSKVELLITIFLFQEKGID